MHHINQLNYITMKFQSMLDAELTKVKAGERVKAEVLKNRQEVYDTNMIIFKEFIEFINEKYSRRAGGALINGYDLGIESSYDIELSVGHYGYQNMSFSVDAEFNFIITSDRIEAEYNGSTKDLETFIGTLIRLIAMKYKK